MSGCKFLFMADHHVVDVACEADAAAYPMWRPGDHAALAKTYEFIGTDPCCRDIDFALFGGDQINCGYMDRPAEREAELAAFRRTLQSLDLHRRTHGADIARELDFRAPAAFVCNANLPEGYVRRPIPFRPPESRVIAIQGNHDTGVDEFYRDCAFTAGDTRFVTFFASYVGLPAPKGHFRSTARISDEAIEFMEKEMAAAAADPSIRHIVLVSHWAIAPKSEDFACPIIDACKENKFNDNRKRLLALAEKFGCDLFINGHEHNGRYPVGRAGCLSDVNCGTVTGAQASWSIVEIHPDKAVFNVYSRAAAVETSEGNITYTQLPKRLFTREIPLKPMRA